MNYKIKDLPTYERPREKLIKFGKESLSLEELLAILINTGTREKSSKDIAIEVTKSLENYQDLNDITINELCKIDGIKEVKAVKILAAIELGRRLATPNVEKKYKITNAADVYNYFKIQIIGLKQERLYAIFLNTKSEMLGFKIIFVGTQNMSITHPREVFNEAIKASSVKIIIMHNHPGEDPYPSSADIKFTKELVEAGKLLKIPVIDHIILTRDNFFSFYENDML